MISTIVKSEIHVKTKEAGMLIFQNRYVLDHLTSFLYTCPIKIGGAYLVLLNSGMIFASCSVYMLFSIA